jgi:hypothetical protein
MQVAGCILSKGGAEETSGVLAKLDGSSLVAWEGLSCVFFCQRLSCDLLFSPAVLDLCLFYGYGQFGYVITQRRSRFEI